jgi:hypothetical protein
MPLCAHLEHKRRNVSEQDFFEQTSYRTVQHTILVVFYVIKQKENHSVFSDTSQNFGLILVKCLVDIFAKTCRITTKLREYRFYRNYRLYTIRQDFQTPIICKIVTPYERRLN